MESKCPDETAHVQDDLNLRILRMFECTFSLESAHINFCSTTTRIVCPAGDYGLSNVALFTRIPSNYCDAFTPGLLLCICESMLSNISNRIESVLLRIWSFHP